MVHSFLIEKIKSKNLGFKFINSIQSLYFGTKLRARVENTLSEPFNYNRGVRQDCPTTTLLFDLFIDDLLNDIRCILVPYYRDLILGFCSADDTLILGDSLEDINMKCRKLDIAE